MAKIDELVAKATEEMAQGRSKEVGIPVEYARRTAGTFVNSSVTKARIARDKTPHPEALYPESIKAMVDMQVSRETAEAIIAEIRTGA